MLHASAVKTSRISNFPPTQWTVVVKACREGTEDEQRRALESLCRDYWFPLYAFARRSGNRPPDAEDLTQGFFHYLLDRDLVSAAKQELGKLRTFLLTAFQRYIGDVRTRAHAIKRGGGAEDFSLDLNEAERHFKEPADWLTPHQTFDRHWALTVLHVTLAELGASEQVAGKSQQFTVLEPFLNPASNAEADYPSVAVQLGLSAEATRKAVSRLRGKFRDLLRARIAATLSTPTDAQVDEELAALKLALRG